MSNYSRRLARWSACAVAMIAAVGGYLAATAPGRPVTTSLRATAQTLTARDAASARDSNSCFSKAVADFIGSAYVIGFSNATKLDESTLVGPGPGNKPKAALQGLHNWYILSDLCTQKTYEYVTGVLDYRNLPQMPPVRATFLNFGFEPVSATLQLTEEPIPTPCRDAAGHTVAPPPVYTCLVVAASQVIGNQSYSVTAVASVEAHIENVTVNGAPLAVGPGCRTQHPFPLILTANSGNQYNVLTGGLLTGKFTIGRLTGCGVAENLDPLFDSSLSGVQNLIKITQGPTCADWINPPIGLNANCLVPPGPGHPWGIPKYLPIPKR
jgi:hypothetical protein